MAGVLLAEEFSVQKQDKVNAHYDRIAPVYDEYYYYWHQPISELVVKHLRLQPSDRVADVGAGTGNVAHCLWKKAGLQSVLAVEPNAMLLERAKGKEGVETLLATADEFISRSEFTSYNKLVMCHSAHHFSRPVETFSALLHKMPADGRCVVVYYPNHISLPLWESALASFNKTPHDLSKPMIEAGLAVAVHEEEISYRVTKSFWFNRLRGRVYSPLEYLTDEEIEEGLSELDSGMLKGVGLDEEFEIKEKMMFAVGTPPATV